MKVTRNNPEQFEAVDICGEQMLVLHELAMALFPHGYNLHFNYGEDYTGGFRLTVTQGTKDQFAAVGDKVLVIGGEFSGLTWVVSDSTRLVVYSDTYDVKSDTPNNLSDFDTLFGGA